MDSTTTCATSALAILAAISTLGSTGCASDRGRSPESIEPEVRTEMRLERGLPLVEARLPGEGELGRAWFLIDTGAGNFTLLDEGLTGSLRLKHDLVRDPLMPSIHFSAVVPFVEVDGMGRKDLLVYVTDGLADRTELADLGVRVQGVLGAGYFRGRCLAFDWANKEFTATRPRKPLARHVTIPLRFGQAGDLHATVRVNGHDAEVVIDTGSGQTLVAQEVADRLGIAYDRGKVAPHRETSIGAAAVREGTIERLSLGTQDLTKVPVLVLERRLPNADIVLGTDVLSRFGVILDLADHAWLVLDPLEGGI